MIQPFKKVHNISDFDTQRFHDNVEQWSDQFRSYPSAVIDADVIRLPRPRYYADTQGTALTIPADPPIRFKFGRLVYSVAEDILVDLSRNGRGGLDSGTIAANTPYYLYGVLSDGVVDAVASIRDPTEGPFGFTDWTYLGALATDEGSASFTPFQAINGTCLANEEIEIESHTGDTTPTAKVFASIPTTARAVYGILKLAPGAADGVGDDVMAGGTNTSEDSIRITGQVADIEFYGTGWVPIFTAQTIYLATTDSDNTSQFEFQGWMENPMEYP